MSLSLDTELEKIYINKSQKIRVLTEGWALKEIYCPNCGGPIYNYNNNKPVADFYCKKCIEDFELKSKNGQIGKKVPAGAYNQMIDRINSLQKPNFFFMSYLDSLDVNSFFVIPKHFFVSRIIEKRLPLAITARRAGWVGSNILFSKIPKAGQIFYIENGKVVNKKDVLEKWQKTIFLKRINQPRVKGWIIDIMNCIDMLSKKDFELKDIYEFEEDLQLLHQENKNIKAKIRQQLQFLRNEGYLEFTGSGTYRLK